MLLPGGDGELLQGNVEELNAAVAAGGQDLVLVRFRPGGVEEGILGIKPLGSVS